MNNDFPIVKAYRCLAFGDYHDLDVMEVQPTPLGEKEAFVRVHAAAVGFPDMLMVQGRYQLKPTLPFTPGTEFAGEVAAVGSGLTGISLGECVMGTVRFGAFAQFVTVRAEDIFPLPADFDFATGAAFLVAYKTAYVGLVVRGDLKAGETVLVHGAAGGVGLAAVELAKTLGARVIGMASGTRKLAAVLDKGADYVFDYKDGSFREVVKELTGGLGADVIYDPIGGDVFDESLHCIAPFGRLLVIGFASGRIPELAVNYALLKQCAIVGVRAGEYGRVNRDGGQEVNRVLLDMAGQGRLRPHIHSRLPFHRLVEAFDAVARRKVIGRIVIDLED